MARVGVVAVVAVIGCNGEPPDGIPGAPGATPSGELVADGIAGKDCVDPEEVWFEAGGQGGFHAELGVVARTPDQGIRMTVTLADAGTGAWLGDAELNIALVGWTPEDPEGWATTQTRIGTGFGGGRDVATVCSMAGRPILVTACATDLLSDAESCVEREVAGWFDDVDGVCR